MNAHKNHPPLSRPSLENRSLYNSDRMRTKVLLLATLLPLSFLMTVVRGDNSWYDVRDFGAKGDGQTINTDVINRAIDEAVRHGGGTVFFPAGNYLSYSIQLQNSISLYLDQGTEKWTPKFGPVAKLDFLGSAGHERTAEL